MAAELDRAALSPAEVEARIAAAKAELHATADEAEARARYLANPRNWVREHPVPTAVAAGLALFVIVGGPRRAVHALRGVFGGGHDDAYDRLPRALQSFVDLAVNDSAGNPDAARATLSTALAGWARDPSNKRSARDLAKDAIEGPPGPGRAFWRAVEVAAVAAAGMAVKNGFGRLAQEIGVTNKPGTPTPDSGWRGWSRSGGGQNKAP
jgi:hypothetical protein